MPGKADTPPRPGGVTRHHHGKHHSRNHTPIQPFVPWQLVPVHGGDNTAGWVQPPHTRRHKKPRIDDSVFETIFNDILLSVPAAHTQYTNTWKKWADEYNSDGVYTESLQYFGIVRRLKSFLVLMLSGFTQDQRKDIIDSIKQDISGDNTLKPSLYLMKQWLHRASKITLRS